MDEKVGQATGYALAVLQAVLYSTMGIFGKLLYATGLDAQQVVILRFACSTVLLGTFMAIWRRKPLVSRQPAVYAQAAIFFGSAVFYFMAVERMNAGIATVFFYLYPVMVAAINLFVFHERISVPVAAALVMSVMGLVLIAGVLNGGLTLDPLGIAFALAGALAFAVYTVLIQKTGRTEGSFTVTFTLSWTNLLASCLFFAPAVPAMSHLSAYQIGVGCLMALANTILPIVVYIHAVKRIGGTKSSLIGISETPFSLLFAFLILGETIAGMEAAGIALVIASIVLVTLAPRTQRKEKG